MRNEILGKTFKLNDCNHITPITFNDDKGVYSCVGFSMETSSDHSHFNEDTSVSRKETTTAISTVLYVEEAVFIKILGKD